MNKKFQKVLVIGALLFGLWANAVFVLAAELTVKSDTAKIRAEASTSSEVVGSAAKGKKVTIEGEATDSSGMVWYKVSIGGNNYGYIRSDLVETSGVSNTGGNTGGSNQPVQTAATVPTAIDEQQATISQSSVNIRSGASTSHSTVASLPSGTVITLIGEAKDSSGKQWYQMKCTYNNKEVTGYVRYDLITIGAAVQPTEEAPAEDANAGEVDENGEPAGEGGEEVPQEATEEPVSDNKEYEIVYEKDDIGEYAYYLYDYGQGNKQKLADLLSVVTTAQKNQELYQKQINNEKIIIIILAVVIVALALVVTILLFKIRDLYDDYDDEDDEEEEEDYPPRRKPTPAGGAARTERNSNGPQRREQPQQGARRTGDQPSRQGQPRAPQSGQPRQQARPVSRPGQEPEGRRPARPRDGELYAAERPANRPAPARKPQNFLNDDDEFEFEFLNMDDKDL